MELKYQIPTKAYHLEDTDEYEYDYREVTVEVDDKELSNFVATCIFDEHFEKGMFDGRERKELIEFINDFIREKDLTEQLANEFYDIQVYEHFRKDAR